MFLLPTQVWAQKVWIHWIPLMLFLLKLLTSCKEPRLIVHQALMVFLPGCSGPLLTPFLYQLPPCLTCLSDLEDCQPCGKCPMLCRFPRILPNMMSARIGQFLYCPSSVSAWRVTLNSSCWNTSLLATYCPMISMDFVPADLL